jgi:hypothetical protein
MPPYTIHRCPCGDPDCKHWHISGIADDWGVRFTEAQAKAVAALLNYPKPCIIISQAEYDELQKHQRRC